MREHPIFKTLSNEEYETTLEFFEPKTYKKGGFLLKEGEYSSRAFILLEGIVEIYKTSIYNDDYVVTKVKGGGEEFFGEINLIDTGLVTSTIKALSDVKTLEIEHNAFITLMDNYPNIGSKMLWMISLNLSKHLRKADNEILTLFNALVEVVEND